MNIFWLFLAACGIIASLAQKNQAKRRRKTLKSDSIEDDATNSRLELERQLREIFGEPTPQGGGAA